MGQVGGVLAEGFVCLSLSHHNSNYMVTVLGPLRQPADPVHMTASIWAKAVTTAVKTTSSCGFGAFGFRVSAEACSLVHQILCQLHTTYVKNNRSTVYGTRFIFEGMWVLVGLFSNSKVCNSTMKHQQNPYADQTSPDLVTSIASECLLIHCLNVQALPIVFIIKCEVVNINLKTQELTSFKFMYYQGIYFLILI